MNAPRTPAVTASLALALGLATGSPALRAQDPPPPDFAALLRNALFEEEASRDLEKAAAGYEAVLAAHEKQRQMAATALYRLAEVRRKQGRNKDAAAIYQRLISEFPGADPLPRLSRENLAAMGESAPDASPANAPSGISEEEEAELVRLASLAKNSPDLLNAEDGQPLETPLVRACRQGWIRAATFLLDAGVPPAATSRKASVLPAGAPGRGRGRAFNPLATAAHHGHLALCELLLARGAPPGGRLHRAHRGPRE